ncbi:helicase-associated domain-containing protein [Actinopolyspora mortivallis]|uniref:helicase-associated domain-containing protein n=1 Tax=Actinopolyspora mortivallis TaxID=33906 RepID=UPI000368A7B5|nr:helicase-associated domain-containing protein [Actinopolyspora mortivallis]
MPPKPASQEQETTRDDVESLAARLRAASDEHLTELLRLRPDLATPPPTDTTVLANRATVRASVARACEDLDSFTLTVLEALVVLGADEHGVTVRRLTEFLGTGVTVEQTTGRLEVLRARALVWGERDELRVPATTREVLRAHPGGLGTFAPDLSEAHVRRLLDGLDDEERRGVERLAWSSPVGNTREARRDVARGDNPTPVQRLLDKGVLLRRDENTVELPGRFGLAVRGPEQPMGRVETAEPIPELVEHGVGRIDEAAAGELLELNRHVELLLRDWEREPPDVLRSGGIGIREVRRTAKSLDVDEDRAGLLAELVVAAGLVDTSADEEGPQWVPTVRADSWLAAAPEQRWAVLAGSWLDSPRLPGLIGSRDERGRLLGPLSEGLRRPTAPRERRRVLELLDELPSGHGVRHHSEVAAVLAWRAPRRGGPLRDEVVHWVLSEATALGVVAAGGLSSGGRTLLAGDEDTAARVMGGVIPEPVDHVLVQADLTVVAPGRLTPELAAEMELVADVESAGSATVYRVSESSVRRALDAGRDSERLHELFRTRSRTPVPQALSYLVDDTARRHGRLRAGTASSFLRCEDPVVLTEVLGRSELSGLALRRIAPTVLVSPLPLEELVEQLRSSGYAPVAENAEGGVLDLRPRPQRIRGRGRHGGQRGEPTAPSRPDEGQLAERVRTLRAGDQAAAVDGNTIAPERGRPSAEATLKLLRTAAERGDSVWLGFVDVQGGATQRIVRPVSVGNGVLQGFDTGREELGSFPLHRITSVAVVRH